MLIQKPVTPTTSSLVSIPGTSRGVSRADWLKSWHSFSFGEYHDPRRMAFGNIRVINDDVIAGGGGFPFHPHRDMEIVTLILSGELAHKDSLGSVATIRPGDIQRMSAGAGIVHSEFNASETEAVHLLQIWILPKVRGEAPSYSEKRFDEAEYENRFRLIVSGDGREGSVQIKQEMDLYRAHLKAGANVAWDNKVGRMLYLHVATGRVTINSVTYQGGDAITLTDPESLFIAGEADSDLLLFDQALQ